MPAEISGYKFACRIDSAAELLVTSDTIIDFLGKKQYFYLLDAYLNDPAGYLWMECLLRLREKLRFLHCLIPYQASAAFAISSYVPWKTVTEHSSWQRLRWRNSIGKYISISSGSQCQGLRRRSYRKVVLYRLWKSFTRRINWQGRKARKTTILREVGVD